MISTNQTPSLPPAGAGLPIVEAFLAKFVLFPFLTMTTSWDSATRKINRRTKQILALADHPKRDHFAVPILIPRLSGLEGSSCFWSVNMVIEHLIIVGRGYQKIAESLIEGRPYARKVRIEDVKPSGTLRSPEIWTQFQQTYDSALLLVESYWNEHKQSPAGRVPHPWFFPLDLRGWHILQSVHLSLHLSQIERILEAL